MTSTLPAPDHERRYVPATGRRAFTRLYDPVVALTTRERRFRALLREQVTTDLPAGGSVVGTLLGFDAARPNAEADPDVAWRDGTDIWIVFEAKTEESPDAPLSASDVRQAETHVRWVEHELAWEPTRRSVLAIVCPRTTVHDAAKKSRASSSSFIPMPCSRSPTAQ